MPLNVRRFGASWFLVFLCLFAVSAQSPTSADVMRERITKAKAFVAVRNYSAAIYELEGIRRETNEPTVGGVVQVMLMNCFLEQSDYKRAQSLLSEVFNAQKSNRPNANYFAVAGQIVKGTRSQLERYKSLGLMVSDRNLPKEVVSEVDKMRETIETVITQSKTLGANKKDIPNALALLEEATNARSGLARDDYDAKRWKDEVADARESLMSSRSSTIVNAVNDSAMENTTAAGTVAAANTNLNVQKTNESSSTIIPVSNPSANASLKTDKRDNQTIIETPRTNNVSPNSNQTEQPRVVQTPKEVMLPRTAAPSANTPTSNTNTENTTSNTKSPSRTRQVQNADSSNAANASDNKTPIAVGSLIEYATQKVNPVYPQAAKMVRMMGLVRVEVVVNEDGEISVQNTSGPSMLQRAALDAVKRWKFKPFTRGGQPVKATGFVNFNFAL